MSKDYIIEQLKKQIEGFEAEVKTEKVGTVVEIGDGIAKISGLSDVMASEMLQFANASESGANSRESVLGVALNLEEDQVGAMILGEYKNIKEGDKVKSTGRILSIPVTEKMIGRVVNPLGRPIDGRADLYGLDADSRGQDKDENKNSGVKYYPIEKIAPGVMARKSVHQPVQTGIKAIDSMIPIGRGQRELIIGDRQTGKTAIAIDAIINQKGQDLICVYVAIGQKESKVARIVAELEKKGRWNIRL